MKMLAKVTIASLALAGMLQADTMLFGVDAGVTIGGTRLGVVAGITVGNARSYNAVGSSCCPTACPTVEAPAPSSPCDYVPAPCVVVEPCPTVVVCCDPCDPCAN